ncbi:hypothetical protein SELMODRAFT_227210 [Selaginella moellendorffii]|uniref:Ketoreductase domain-containing protein n=2 Tax=Selaginella moellendorffii TaxID=88036 RepID=D8QNF9_SELML|nr:hypothetical protein SELMODRAFT_227210 [Selaginella moellendorffii]
MGLGGSRLAPKDLVVLITGCSEGGIGHALAAELGSRGCTVVASARSLASIRGLEQQQPSSISCITLDVLDEDSMSRAVESTIQRFGKIDVLINNAGVPCLGPIAEIPLEMLERAYRTNVFGTVSLIQKVVPFMVKQGRGRIVNVGSIGAYASGPWMAGYTSSKAALHALTDSLRVELRPFNIDVILVTPGAIVSNIGKAALSTGLSYDLKIYKPFQESIEYRGMLSQGPKSTPAPEFARAVASKILDGKPPSYFGYGHFVPLLWSMFYAPAWVRDWFFVKLLKIDKVKLVKN